MIHGVLLINKKEGGTSHDVVQSIRKLLKQRQVGHAGTLDPMAEGLMVILLGYGTKLSEWLLRCDKSYRFVFRLGLQTDTLDKTGQVTMTKKVQITDSPAPQNSLPPSLQKYTNKQLESSTKKQDILSPTANKQEVIKLSKGLIQDVIKKAQGEISMPVPVFSAVKVKGQKLYEYQRRGQDVAPPLRQMVFYDVRVKDIKSETVEVVLACQKGSYVRAWVSYIGEQLGTGACLESLTRLSSAPFEIGQALSLEELTQRLSQSNLEQAEPLDVSALLKPAFLPFHQALPHIPEVQLLAGDEQTLKHGRLSVDVKYALQEKQKEVNKNRVDQIVRAMGRGGKMLALLKLTPFKSPRVAKLFPPYL